MISRRKALQAGVGLAAISAFGAPSILHAQTKTLKITTWGGKWGDIMKATVLPAFEKEFVHGGNRHRLRVHAKLQASSRSAPIYDVLHSNSNEQWAALEMGIVEEKIDARQVPNIADVYPYAVSDKMVGVCIFTSAIGLGMRTDKGFAAVASWKNF
jgi:putative spermidine/putrescine transport system substrate-binding protein